MNEIKAARPSLSKIVEHLMLFDTGDISVDQFQDMIKCFESNIEDLEARVQSLQNEVEILIAEQ
ncbi:MAG: hypothetical protein AAF652_14235 [Cyanobacteria bacterium P01_C01_bin.72]